jgi:hypothetical protein
VAGWSNPDLSLQSQKKNAVARASCIELRPRTLVIVAAGPLDPQWPYIVPPWSKANSDRDQPSVDA